ncbi:MAG: hypothetical protein HRT73_09965 [Flavobacteriales bacterium]|nr:hypothetical protein [Flavobacteriales bacterium]
MTLDISCILFDNKPPDEDKEGDGNSDDDSAVEWSKIMGSEQFDLEKQKIDCKLL